MVFFFELYTIVFKEFDNVEVGKLRKSGIQKASITGDVAQNIVNGVSVGHVATSAACHEQFFPDFFIFVNQSDFGSGLGGRDG